MVLAYFYDVTDDKIWRNKAGPHLFHSFMCSAPQNSYLSRRTYTDTSVELVEARAGLTSFGHVRNFYCNSRTNCKCIRAAIKEPRTKHKANSFNRFRLLTNKGRNAACGVKRRNPG